MYTRSRREQWLNQLLQAGQRYRAERMFEQFDSLQALRRQIRSDLIQEGEKHTATAMLSSIPFVGPIRSALLIARVQTPFRFRSKRQFWAYCGLALETRSSADHQVIAGELRRKSKPVFIRGLNLNHNPDLKNIFKSAATTASASPGPFRDFYENLLAKGMKPEMGQADPGAQDRRHQFECLEERRAFRSRATKNTSSLSAQRHRGDSRIAGQSLSARVRG